MRTQTHQHAPPGTNQQDRTLSDLLESFRHLESDGQIPDERKAEAAERMKPVWSKLAKLQDPDGFINHLSETIQREYQRRHADDGANVTRRAKPLCRCDLPRHVCETKQGEVPSKIRTQDLEYIHKPDNRTLAREYVQEHAGDVVVREAMETFRGLRADIYAELSSILAMMRAPTAPAAAGRASAADRASERPGDGPAPTSTNGTDGTGGRTASADGGGTSGLVDAALASAVERHGPEQMAQDAVDGVQDLASVVDAFQNGEVDAADLQAIADGERSVADLNLETEQGGEGDE